VHQQNLRYELQTGDFRHNHRNGTNITAPEKQAIARALVSQANIAGDAMVNTQVPI
jgi:shikimate 5-dehydrogenase